ncbi:hypothetical protein D1O30_18725 [Methylocystis hirsuta]|uniref:Uncharacterized protein n=1 Tax=Methylocystis hirsuta TaxID=369798 RepID=A0A3M9XUK3_9HYPH|nr:hypothetical protein D1O30_18725 [Methylocystis hirsuta]
MPKTESPEPKRAASLTTLGAGWSEGRECGCIVALIPRRAEMTKTGDDMDREPPGSHFPRSLGFRARGGAAGWTASLVARIFAILSAMRAWRRAVHG